MRVLIIGCGRLGTGLAQNLALRGVQVWLVDRDPQAFARLGPGFQGRTVLGSALERQALMKAGIERADGLAALTGSDEVNVVTARLAREFFRVPKVVARLYEPQRADLYRRLGVQTVATVDWAAGRLAELLTYSEVETVMNLGGGQVDLLEAEAPALLAGRTPRELGVPGEAQVVAVTRGGRTFLSTPDTVFQEGDRVYVAVLAASAGRLRTLLGLA